MTYFIIHHFEALKTLVLATAGYRNVAPSDCKALSLKIFRKTNQQISETTLKRIYGFAYSKFKPSLFTLDAMATFCDYNGWADFCEKNGDTKVKNKPVADVNWNEIKQNAEKITRFTLQVLKNKSGIPYSQTIKRDFIDDHFSAFLEEDYTATLLTAPAGYGKTIGLCHWIEDRLMLNTIGANDDIILFFSSSALINVFTSGKDINEWILSLLGYGAGEDLSTLLEKRQSGEGNFFLIIDGLDEHMFKSEQFYLLLTEIQDVLSFYQSYNNFKLILTMRSASWINQRHVFDNFNSKWFNGFMHEDGIMSNVPLFSTQEIKNLCTKINPAVQNIIGIEVAENFNHPLYFQFYYKEHKENFSLNNIDHICIYELVSMFILNKIYLGNHSGEKALLISALIGAMDFKSNKFEVPKMKLNTFIKQYNQAYNDLLGVGFIREINKSDDLQYNTVIQFGNDNFLNYSIARWLLFRNNNVFDMQVITAINESFPSERKVQLLKWCIIYAIKNGQQESFSLLAETDLADKEKSDLIVFLGDMFEKSCCSPERSEELVQYFQQDCSDELFNYFFGIEFINADYKKALHTLLGFELSDQKKILVYTGLAVISVIELDINELEEYLIILKSFSPDDMMVLPINPLNCLETIYYNLKHGIVKKEGLVELTKFYFNPPQDGDALKRSSTNDVLYLLGAYTLSICKNPVKSLRYINALVKTYNNTHEKGDGYRFLLKLMTAESYFLSGNVKEGLRLYDEIHCFYNANKHSYTPFMIASFHLLKAKVDLYKDKKSDMPELMRLSVGYAEQSGFKLIKVQSLAHILSNKWLLFSNNELYKRTHFEFKRTVRESGFREGGFIEEELIQDI